MKKIKKLIDSIVQFVLSLNEQQYAQKSKMEGGAVI